MMFTSVEDSCSLSAVSPAFIPLAVGLDWGCSLYCAPGDVGRWKSTFPCLSNESWLFSFLPLSMVQFWLPVSRFFSILFTAVSSWCIISRNLDPVYIYNHQPRNKKEEEKFRAEISMFPLHTTFSHGNGRCSSWPVSFTGGGIQWYSDPTLPNASLGISGCVMHTTARLDEQAGFALVHAS